MSTPIPRRKWELFPFFILLILLICGCKDQVFDEHYKRPDWLKGNAWEVLEERKEFSIFLEAVQRSGFRSLVDGKGIITVMAPTNEAFEAYFQANGIGSLEAMSSSDIRKLVGYHLVYYSFNKTQFENYQPDGQGVVNPLQPGAYYKHRTKSRDTLSALVDITDGKVKNVFHKERFLPVFSNLLFSSRGIDPTTNYEYFYPESSWTGESGFNVSNASVTEYEVPTDNGYLYVIDQVLEPLETVHTALKNEPNYSEFIAMYDRFAFFWYDQQTSQEFANAGDSLYILQHTGLPQIASEWSYNGEGGLPDYANLPVLSSKAFNVFAPGNNAISTFFNDFWGSHYSSIEDVDFLPIAFLLHNHVYEGSLVFPEEITLGEIASPYGNAIEFDPQTDVTDKQICVNGAYYGLDKVVVPDMFRSVTGPVFQDPDYKMFLYMLTITNKITPLMSDALGYTLFIPSDEVLLETIYQGSNIFWVEGSPVVYGDEEIQVENSEGLRVPMSTSSMNGFVQNHIVTEEITTISGKKVYRTLNPFSYLYITPADSLASSSTYNISAPVGVDLIDGDWYNGTTYSIDRSLLREEGSFKYLIAAATSGTSLLNDFSEFSKLLSQAGLIQINQELSFLFGDRFVLFAPSNEAILDAQGAGLIPAQADSLADFCKYYFVPVTANSLTDYPFEGFGVEGEMLTSYTGKTLTVIDNETNLQVSDENGSIANVISEFPRIYADGAIYQIDTVLLAQ